MKISRNYIPLIAYILFFVLFVSALIFTQERVVTSGEAVILKTRPVDPRDLLRGEYVILRYEIETAAPVIELATQIKSGSRIYVLLEPDATGVARAVNAQLEIPENTPGIWLQGVVMNGAVRFTDIEQFYVPEGAGKRIEVMQADLHVLISIKNDTARALRLLDKNLETIDPLDYTE